MKKKILVACLCVALAVLTIAGTTLAYLTSKDTVTNTFTVGNVSITLDEVQVNPDGTAVTPPARVKDNSYKLIPGQSYTKDPTVHVTAKSEDSWIFVKVENGIAALEPASSADYKTIADQISAKGWKLLTKDVDGNNVTGVYYKEYSTSDTQQDLGVFENFKIANDANTRTGGDGTTVIWNTINESNKPTVKVNAYDIQKEGFNTAAAAWAEISNTYQG